MRINSLTITGFGPFAGTEHIDFEQLSAEGLFLIAGKTGAGKSTILDAICFALYGSVPGARGQARQLRSHYVDARTPTEVTLDFEARGRRLRIERSPEYQRPKKRGTGLTTSPARCAVLEYRNGTWHGLARTAKDAAEVIYQTIGLSAEQFSQIILLPQGAFAEFLRAQPADRENLLEKLFGTARFGRVEDLFRKQRTGAAQQLESISQRRRDLVQLTFSSTGLPAPALESHPDSRAVLALLTVARVHAQETAEVLGRAAAPAATAAAAAQERLRALKTLRADVIRYGQHQSQLEKWTSEAPLRRELEDSLRAAEAAVPLHTVHREWRDARSTVADLEEQLHAHTGTAALGDLDVDGLTARIETTRTALTAAARYADDWAARESLEQRRRQLTAAKAEAAEQVEQLTAEQRTLTDQETRLQAEVDSFESIAAAEAQLRTAEERLRKIMDLQAALQEKAKDVQLAKAQLEEIRAHESAAAAHLARLRTQRIAGIAAELAAHLASGQPCPVCGSATHPRPAHADDRVTEAQEREAHDVAARLSEQLVASEKKLTGLTSTEQALNDELAGLGGGAAPDAARLQEQVAAQRVQLDAVRESQQHTRRQLQDVRTRAEALADRASTVSERLAQLTADISQVQGNLDAVDTSPTAAEKELFTNLDVAWPADAAQMRDAAAALRESLTMLDQLHGQRVRHAQAVRERDKWTARWEGALADSEFADEAAFLQALELDRDAIRTRLETMRELRVRLTAAESEEWYRRAEQNQLSLADIDESLLTAEDRSAAWSARSEHLQSRVSVAHHEQSRVQALSAEFAGSAPAEDEHLGRLREEITLTQIITAASNDNTKHISLKSFVLLDLFKRVTEAASERLLRMSQGRYSLLHHLDRGTNQRSAGLGLIIMDEFTGEARDARTLSGGESFIAALALALGLADTVAATVGGIELDTLFIDEGFGSLDPESLNRVLEVLDQLRSGGRTVGVISHVASMHETIPLKITVKAGPHGSRILIDSQENANTPHRADSA